MLNLCNDIYQNCMSTVDKKQQITGYLTVSLISLSLSYRGKAHQSSLFLTTIFAGDCLTSLAFNMHG